MLPERFVSVGFGGISKDFFRRILRPLDNFSFKPSGGFWASYETKYGVSGWMDYIAGCYEKPSICYEKDYNIGVSFSLKDTAKILVIDYDEKLMEIAKLFPSTHHKNNYNQENEENIIFDFEKLSLIYDGVYIKPFSTNLSSKIFKEYCCDSLLLFNLDCIKSYRTIEIDYDVNKIDDEDNYPTLKNSSEEKQVEEHTIEYLELEQLAENLFYSETKNLEFIDSDDYLSKIITTSMKITDTLLIEQRDKIEKIKINLSKNKIYADNDTVIRNLVFNIASKYLLKNKSIEEKLEKSKVDYKKYYEEDYEKVNNKTR